MTAAMETDEGVGAPELRRREVHMRLEAEALHAEIDAAHTAIESLYAQTRRLKQRADVYKQEVNRLLEENKQLREQAHVATLKVEVERQGRLRAEVQLARALADVERLQAERLGMVRRPSFTPATPDPDEEVLP